jgi:NAD-dependent SIR2 family protein deacetylase
MAASGCCSTAQQCVPVIGTSGVVHPAAALPHHAQAGGALDGLLDTHLYGLAGQLLLALVTMLDTFTEAR